MLNELEARGCAYWDVYPKFYIASVGAHIFNVHSLVKQILYVSGLPYDTRIHIFLVSYPGFGKTFWLMQFLHSEVGLLGATSIPTGFEGYLTEAGWVGTRRFGEDGDIKQMGAAQEYATGIVGCEEFAAVSNAMKQSYNKQMDVALLTSLDSGYVNKRLAAGPIKYKTSVTLMTGTQPARFDLAGGLGRRLTFLHFIPTDEDIELLRKTRRKGVGTRFNVYRTDKIREYVNQRKREVSEIKDIHIDPTFYRLLDRYKMMPYEEPIYERLALGHKIMTGEFTNVLQVTVDDDIKYLVDQEYNWRMQIKRGSEHSQILEYIRSKSGMEIGENELLIYMYNLGYDDERAQGLIDRLVKLQSVKRKTVEGTTVVYIQKRKVKD